LCLVLISHMISACKVLTKSNFHMVYCYFPIPMLPTCGIR
jgi:hypothetical protein